MSDDLVSKIIVGGFVLLIAVLLIRGLKLIVRFALFLVIVTAAVAIYMYVRA